MIALLSLVSRGYENALDVEFLHAVAQRIAADA